MINSKNPAGDPGSFSPFTLVAAVIAICAVGAVALLAPAAATSQASSTAAYAGPTGYFPDQFVNQAKQIEPMPDTYSNTGLAGYFPDDVNQGKEIDSTPEMFN
jgi:hypothetical protein